MTTRTVTEHVASLLNRRVAEARIGGLMSPDFETLALFETVALNFLTKPRSALYVAHLARNALLSAAEKEIGAIDTLKATIEDLGNTSLSLNDPTTLKRARVALLQMESQPKIDVDSQAYKRFSDSIDEFLNKHVGKNIRRKGDTELRRPGDEAKQDLVSDYSNLKSCHTDLLDRLYSLTVGITNFLNSPFGTLLGMTAASRARSDIETIISSVEAGAPATESRDIAIRLFSNRASVKVLGSRPDLWAPVMNTEDRKPDGYDLTATTQNVPATKTSLAGPFPLPASSQVSVRVRSTVIGPTNFPQVAVSLSGKPLIVGAEVIFPVSVEPNTYLFFRVDFSDGTFDTVRVSLNSTGAPVSLSLAGAISAITSAVGLNGTRVTALEFCQNGTSRILVYVEPGPGPVTASRISIASSSVEPDPLTLANRVYTTSLHEEIGFRTGQSGTSALEAAVAADAMEEIFGSLVEITRNQDGSFTLSTIDEEPGVDLVITAPAGLGISGTARAQSNRIRLSGTVQGVETDPVNPIHLVDTGDRVVTDAWTKVILSISDEEIVLNESVDTFSGDIEVVSGLITSYEGFNDPLQSFVDEWLSSDFSQDLKKLDSVVATLIGSSAASQRNDAVAILDELRSKVYDLTLILAGGPLPAGSATDERRVVEGIIASFEERKFDRALDYLLRCKLQELFEFDHQSSSFGGNLLKVMSEVAQKNIRFPNQALDEGEVPRGTVDRKGL